jgi:DNA repair photolyase
MPAPDQPLLGRGASANPAHRFERLACEPDPECAAEDAPLPRTQFFKDGTQSLITRNDSPDVGFGAGINVYRGCEHGCIYCYARPSHEYLGFSAGLDFESKIMVKERAPELLRKELSSPRWKPEVVSMSGNTDCYQPAERRFRITRRCLEIFLEFRNPVSIITKNHLVTRDIDLLGELAKFNAVSVAISITTLDEKLRKNMEPRTSSPKRRLAALKALREAGVPAGVMTAPMIPGLNDHEMPAILAAAGEAGALFAGYVPVRLPYGVAPLFEQWLEEHYPGSKEKILNRIRDMRGGKLNDPNFGSRMRGSGVWAEQMSALFEAACKKAGIKNDFPGLTTQHFRRSREQLMLFGD